MRQCSLEEWAHPVLHTYTQFKNKTFVNRLESKFTTIWYTTVIRTSKYVVVSLGHFLLHNNLVTLSFTSWAEHEGHAKLVKCPSLKQNNPVTSLQSSCVCWRRGYCSLKLVTWLFYCTADQRRTLVVKAFAWRLGQRQSSDAGQDKHYA